jgi:hypothetical protein
MIESSSYSLSLLEIINAFHIIIIIIIIIIIWESLFLKYRFCLH